MPLILTTPYLKKALLEILGGVLSGWGYNHVGQLGRSHFRTEPENALRQGLAGAASELQWKSISSGTSAYHFAAIDVDGRLWTWGRNSFGQLGKGHANDIEENYSPTQIGTESNWKQVSCGSDFTIAIKTDGSLWAWGRNGPAGCLGIGNVNIASRFFPVRVGTDVDWDFICCGGGHTAALKRDQTLWTWGSGGFGQLGRTGTSVGPAPGKVGTAKWKSIACGGNFTAGIQISGIFWATGDNQAGQLGDGTTNQNTSFDDVNLSGCKMVRCANSATFVLKDDGTLWSCGANGLGLLGQNRTTTGTGNYDFKRVAALTGIKDFNCGYAHVVAIRSDGTLWSWGANNYGQLGIETIDNLAHPLPLQVGIDDNWQIVGCGAYSTFVSQG